MVAITASVATTRSSTTGAGSGTTARFDGLAAGALTPARHRQVVDTVDA